jgi:hypothetical protein
MIYNIKDKYNNKVHYIEYTRRVAGTFSSDKLRFVSQISIYLPKATHIDLRVNLFLTKEHSNRYF